MGYGIIPHAGTWDQARLSEETSRWNEPLNVALMDGVPKAGDDSRSLVSVSGGGVEIPTVLVDDRRLLMRLFNAEGDASERTVSFHTRPASVDLVEFDGRVVRTLAVERGRSGRYEVKLSMPRFGLRTLRCEMSAAAG